MLGWPFERAADLPQGHDLVVREVAGLRQRRVEHRRRMPLGEDEPVAVRPVGVLGVVPQEPAEIERRHDLDGRQRAAGMPRAGLGRHPQDVFPDRLGTGQQGVKVIGHGCNLLLEQIRKQTPMRPSECTCNGSRSAKLQLLKTLTITTIFVACRLPNLTVSKASGQEGGAGGGRRRGLWAGRLAERPLGNDSVAGAARGALTLRGCRNGGPLSSACRSEIPAANQPREMTAMATINRINIRAIVPTISGSLRSGDIGLNEVGKPKIEHTSAMTRVFSSSVSR